MKDEQFIKIAFEDAEKEVTFLRSRLAKLINETPQYVNQITELTIKLGIANERARILSWILRG